MRRLGWLSALALLAAACGGDDSGDAKASGGAGGGAAQSGGGAGNGGGSGSGGSATGGTGASGGTAGSGGTATGGAAGSGGTPPSCKPSQYYGYDGELWKADGRLMDWAWVGYHTGEAPIPDVSAPTTSVTSFGAKPDDTGDDTQAFLDAIDQTASGVITIPAGKFIISQRLTIQKANLVLRGAGRDKTTLYFPKSLGDVYGLTFNSAGQSNWSFSGGVITVLGGIGGAQLATVTAKAARGDQLLAVSSTSGLAAGQWVRLLMTDSNGSLLKALHEGYYDGDVGEDIGKQVFKFMSRIASVGSGTITLERDLPMDVDPAWSPELRAVSPSVKEVGVEHMTLEFPGTTYPGHFKEHGYNGVYFSGVMDSWVRDVRVLNADYGVNLGGSFFCTATDVELDTNFDRGPLVGHHGLNSSSGGDVLFTKFDVKKKFIHDLTVDNYARGTVFSDGKGVDLDMDHHGRGNTGTLWTQLDFGAATRPWASGGTAPLRMPHSGARSTYWNLVGAKDLPLPPSDFGPLLTFVAVQGSTPAGTPPADWATESIANGELCQPDLHAAMLAKRVK